MNTNRSVLLKADGFLLNHYINRLPLTLEELERIARDMGWLLDTYQEAGEFIDTAGMADFVKDHKAMTTTFEGQTMILYDGQLPYAEKLQYICHEMGHITLRHTTENGIVGLCDDPQRMVMQEEEADAFAAEMMAPACVMHERGITDIEGLINTHLISREQAVKHAENLSRRPDTEEELKLCDVINHRGKTSKNILWGVCAFALICVLMTLLMFVNTINVPDSTSSPAQNSTVTTTAPEPSSGSADTTKPDKTTVPTSGTTTTTTHTEEEPQESSVEPTENAVYVTPKGKKYHKPDCYHIAGKTNIFKLTVEEAEQSGYEPCKDCF